jgi:Mrp family chromosome partitioning ATPase
MAHKPKLVAGTGLAENAGASTLAAGLANALSDGTEGKVILVDKPPATRRFYNMLMEFKASDLDYVVFDMPSLGDTSATLPLAGFMDTVLLVVKAALMVQGGLKANSNRIRPITTSRLRGGQKAAAPLPD